MSDKTPFTEYTRIGKNLYWIKLQDVLEYKTVKGKTRKHPYSADLHPGSWVSP